MNAPLQIPRWYAVDLDSTLAVSESHGMPSDGSIGEPVAAVVERVKELLAQGQIVRIFTARVWPRHTDQELKYTQRYLQALEQEFQIREWSRQLFGQTLEVTCIKDPGVLEIWDDKARQVEPNTGRFLSD